MNSDSSSYFVKNTSGMLPPRRRWILALLLFAGSSVLIAQYKIDSLKNACFHASQDSLRVTAAISLCMAYSSDFPDSCLYFSDTAISLCKNKRLDKYIPVLLKLKGVALVNKSEYQRSLECYFEGVRKAKELKNDKEEASLLNNIGVNYWYQEQFALAKQYYLQALEIRLQLGNKKDLSKSYNNLGIISVEMKNYKEALEYYNKALALKEEIGDRSGTADCYNNIGIVYESMKDSKAAIVAYEHALEIFRELDDVRGEIVSLNNLAIMHKARGENDKAIALAQQSLDLAKGIDDKEDVKNAYEMLSLASYNLHDYKSAYDYLTQFSRMKDTLYDISKADAMSEMETKYQTEQSKQQIQMQQLRIGQQDAEISNGKLIRYGLAAMVALLLILTALIFNRYMLKKRSESEIAAQKLAVENQKKIAETKNSEILDSIRYAERIQKALLPAQEKIRRILPDSFFFYQPKDIVSGDFYWCEQWGNQVLFAAADCTGHGVPGAIISVVGHNLLNQAVNELGLSQPNLILNSVDKGVARILRKRGEDGIVQDGMDISLVSLQKSGDNVQLNYSGAFNPLWIYRSSTGRIEEIKADKISIGNWTPEENKLFTNHSRELQKGDIVYIFTDGYADQFGGASGKKFRYKTMMELLEKIAVLPMNEQMEQLKRTINEWKGPLEQVDDMLVIGVRIADQRG